MDDLPALVASMATVAAAMMTASNLGSRVTGWGFVIFSIGSVAWMAVGWTSGQQSLLLTNAFLTLVNLVGIWRWLGRQARYDDSSREVADRSAESAAPTLFPAGALVGSTIRAPDGTADATVVEAMVRCDTGSIAYVVVSRGGLAGVGETLHAIEASQLCFTEDGLLARVDLATLPPIDPERWPARV